VWLPLCTTGGHCMRVVGSQVSGIYLMGWALPAWTDRAMLGQPPLYSVGPAYLLSLGVGPACALALGGGTADYPATVFTAASIYQLPTCHTL